MRYTEFVDKLDKTAILSDELFIELFDLEDEVTRVRKINALKKRAKELGVKMDFEELLKAYKREYKDALKEVEADVQPVELRPNITDFKGIETQFVCGMWNASDNGIWVHTDRGKMWACYHPIFPGRILVNIETHTCKVELHYKIRNSWRKVLVDKNVIASRSAIIKLADYGIQVTSESAGALVQYLLDMEALNPDLILEYDSTNRLGWIDGKFMPYETEIAFDSEQSISNLFRSIERMGSRDKWYEVVKKIRQKKRIESLIFIAASFASVLVEPCGVLPFIVDLWGETGGGKTVTLKIASSIWANPQEGAYIADAKSTVVSMELKLNALNSLPLMIDDFSQIKNQYDGDFSHFIYFLTAGSGKDRATKNIELRGTTHWKNCTLVNAERSLVAESSQGGAVNRVIDVEVERDIYPAREVQTIVDTVHDNYGWAGPEFIDVIRELGFDEVRSIQKKYQAELMNRAEFRGDDKEQKQVLPVSVILTADEIAEKYLFQDGIRLNFEECYKLIKGKNEVSENIRAYEMLKDVIAANWARFEGAYTDERVEQWGEFSDNDKKSVKIFGTMFDKLMTQGGFQSKTFLSWAAKRGIVETDSKGGTKIVTKYGKHSVRCVWLNLRENADFSRVSDNKEDNPFG